MHAYIELRRYTTYVGYLHLDHVPNAVGLQS